MRGRQSGFDHNPIALTEMVAMIAINGTLGFYEPMDLIDLWQELDAFTIGYWKDRRASDEKRKRELQEKAGNN